MRIDAAPRRLGSERYVRFLAQRVGRRGSATKPPTCRPIAVFCLSTSERAAASISAPIGQIVAAFTPRPRQLSRHRFLAATARLQSPLSQFAGELRLEFRRVRRTSSPIGLVCEQWEHRVRKSPPWLAMRYACAGCQDCRTRHPQAVHTDRPMPPVRGAGARPCTRSSWPRRSPRRHSSRA